MKGIFGKGFLVLAIMGFFLVSCNEEDKIAIERSASVFDIEQGKASIQQSNLRFMKAFEEGDSTEVANCFMKNGVILLDDRPSVEGRDNIRHFFSLIMKNNIAKYELETKNIWGDSSILVEEGTYKLTGPKKKLREKGKYIVLWKQETGNWKMFRDIWARDFPSEALIPAEDSTANSKKILGFF